MLQNQLIKKIIKEILGKKSRTGTTVLEKMDTIVAIFLFPGRKWGTKRKEI